jgi:hypothetical protein
MFRVIAFHYSISKVLAFSLYGFLEKFRQAEINAQVNINKLNQLVVVFIFMVICNFMPLPLRNLFHILIVFIFYYIKLYYI